MVMGFDSRCETLGEIFEGALRSFGPNELFGTKVAGQWRWTTYREFGDLVDRLRGGLASLGVERGDRVAIVSNNRLEWAVTAFACYTLGAVFVPMYEAQSAKEWQFIVSECEAKTLFVANEALFVKARPLLDTIPPLRALVLLSGSHEGAGGSQVRDGKRVAMYSELLGAPAVARTTAAPDDTAVLIYTSGTTGAPKGVVLTNRNIASNVSAIHAVFQFGTSDRSLAFLPWAHVFGQTAELYLLMSFGASMALCEGPDKILDNLAEVKPTLLFSVPRVFNRIYLAVQQQLAVKPKAVQKLVSLAFEIAARERDGRTPKVHERLLRALVDRVVFEKVRARFGGRLRFAVSGSAALSMEVAQFVDSLGILVYEGYGLTETSPVVSVNVPGARRMGTVGRVLPGVRVVIDPTSVQDGGNGKTPQREGEIVVFGPNVMKGYFKREAETAAVVTPDGGFRTGDMGYVDADGYLSITGRIKEQYKLENGKYVVPSPLEEELKLSPYVANVMIYGDNRPFNVALVVANLPAVKKWAEDERISLPTDPSAILLDSRIRALFEREIKRCGATFKGYEAVADFALIPTDFTVDNDMLTPKMSLKRRRVLETYGSLIDSLYAKRRDRSAATVSPN
jgi:long-chain acyl-CoA synthetase